jgi:hypothetical protein
VVVVGLGVVVGYLVYRNRCTTLAKYLPRVPLPAPLWQSLFLGERRCLIVRTFCAYLLCVKGICGSLSICTWLHPRDVTVIMSVAGIQFYSRLVEGPLVRHDASHARTHTPIHCLLAPVDEHPCTVLVK